MNDERRWGMAWGCLLVLAMVSACTAPVRTPTPAFPTATLGPSPTALSAHPPRHRHWLSWGTTR